jgi:hypothetical protein
MNQQQKILQEEIDPQIDELCNNRILQGFFSYGPAKENFETGLRKALNEAYDYIKAYTITRNREKLLDAINLLKFEFMYPSIPETYFEITSDRGIKAVTYRDIEKLSKEVIE